MSWLTPQICCFSIIFPSGHPLPPVAHPQVETGNPEANSIGRTGIALISSVKTRTMPATGEAIVRP